MQYLGIYHLLNLNELIIWQACVEVAEATRVIFLTTTYYYCCETRCFTTFEWEMCCLRLDIHWHCPSLGLTFSSRSTLLFLHMWHSPSILPSPSHIFSYWN
jgi:hypothetical protein